MIRYAAVTDIGVCDKNDDRILVDGSILSSGYVNGTVDTSILAVLCDGVGGYQHGDEAANITVKVFTALADIPVTQDIINSTINEANNIVVAKQKTDISYRKMATTIAGIFIQNYDYMIFNIGDSKIYRYRNPYLLQLSVDHTSHQEALNLGLIDAIDMENKNNHAITRCIGSDKFCQPNIQTGINRIINSDIFLICSDGLSDVVNIEVLEDTLSQPINLSRKCKMLLELANENKSLDNISIILLEVVL